MSVTLLIPARYSSSRFPGKPLALINGKPMIQWVYEQALQVNGVDQIFVATDDLRIKALVESFAGQVIMTSPDAASGTDRIDEASRILGLADDDIVINLQGDQPLVKPAAIEALIALFERQPGQVSMATLGCEITTQSDRDNPNHVKMVFDNDFNALYFSRSCIPFSRDGDDYPAYKHLGIYAYTRGFIAKFAKLPLGRLEALEKLEQLRALEHGYKIKVAIGDFSSPEVDVPDDIAVCEAELAQRV